MKTNKITINVPEGYEIDQEKSTCLEIILREIPKKITDRVKTVDDAIALVGGESCLDVKVLRALETTGDDKAVKLQQWKIIIKALNEGWVPDWNNDNEQKWYPWFRLKGGFSLHYVYDDCSFSNVPPPFVFKTKELLLYATSQFSGLLEVAWS